MQEVVQEESVLNHMQTMKYSLMKELQEQISCWAVDEKESDG